MLADFAQISDPPVVHMCFYLGGQLNEIAQLAERLTGLKAFDPVEGVIITDLDHRLYMPVLFDKFFKSLFLII